MIEEAIAEALAALWVQMKFDQELAGIRSEYKAKRNFIKALADLG